MKRLLYILPTATLLLFSIYAFVPAKTPASNEAIPPTLEKTFKRYTIESGIITYKITGISTGTETIYFDQYGMREAKFTQTESDVFGMKQTDNTLTLLLGVEQYAINLTTKTGTKTTNPMLKKLVDDNEDLGQMGEQMLIDMGGEKTGTEEFMGKTCDKWHVSSLSADLLVYNYITLKMHSSIMGLTIDMEAVELKENAEIPAGTFDIPKDIKIQTVNLDDY